MPTATPCGILAVEQAQHLLADNFSDKLTLRLIGYHVLREQLRSFDGILVDFGEQLLYALAVRAEMGTTASNSCTAA